MPSFKSILLFATGALAGLASATSLPARAAEADHNALDRRCGCSNIPTLFADMQSRVAVVSDNLNAAVGVDGTVNFEVIEPHLEMLRGALGAAVVDVKAMVDLELSAVLSTNGAVISVAALAQLVINVFVAICTVLSVAFHACVKSDIKVCLQFIVSIGACLAELLQVTFSIVAGLQVSFCGLLNAQADVLAIVKLLGLVNITALIKAYVNISL